MQKKILLLLILSLALYGMTGCGKDDPQPKSLTPSASDAAQTSAPPKPLKKILVVHSYNTDYEWVNAVNRGIRMVISMQECELQYFYMDTKRRTEQSWKQQQGQMALDLVDAWQPDTVITVDDNAQEFVGRHLAGRQHPAVIFCGVNREPQVYGYPAANVTGVLERLHFSQSVAFLKKLLPSVTRIVLLTDDSPTSQGAIDYCRTQSTDGVEIVDMQMIDTLDRWKVAVKEYDQRVDAIAVYTYHTLQAEERDQSVSPQEVMDWTVANSKVPILGFLTFAVDDGSLCGVLESGVEQGQLAGDMVRKFLVGTPIDQIPIVTGTRGQTMVNLSSVRRYNLEIAPEILKSVDLVVNGKH